MTEIEEFDTKRKAIFMLKSDLAQNDSILRTIARSPNKSFGLDSGELINLCGQAMARDLSPNDEARLGSQGTFHRLFLTSTTDGCKIVLKVPIFSDGFFDCLMRSEYHVTSFVRSHGIPAPIVVLLEVEGRYRRYAVHAACFDKSPSLATFDDDEAATNNLLGSASALLRRLHSIEGKKFGPVSLAYAEGPTDVGFERSGLLTGVHDSWDDFVLVRLDEHVAVCSRIDAISSAEAERITSIFENARDELTSIALHSIMHGDPGGNNFLIGGNEPAMLLDWEDCLIGDPMFDVACLATFHPERRLPAIFEGYGLGSIPQFDNLRRFWIYFLRIALAKTVHRHRFGYVDLHGRSPAAKRIQLALEWLTV